MGITTMTSRMFNQDVSKAKKQAFNGPVFITDRGEPKHVLLSIDDYQKITNQNQNIADLLAMPEAAEIDFEPVRMKDDFNKPADLS